MLVRVDKILSQLQIASRSESKKLFAAGRVRVGETLVKNGSFKFDPASDKLYVDGVLIDCAEHQYFMLNKPAGCVTATEDARERTVMEYLPAKRHRNLSPVGRLDKDTEGLLLITDDGALNHALLAPGRHVEKEYVAVVKGCVTEETVLQFAEGLEIGEKKPTAPAKLTLMAFHEKEKESEVRIVITEGKFHQIKRMFHTVGMEVSYLKRVRMGTLVLDRQLQPGACRELTSEEVAGLLDAYQ